VVSQLVCFHYFRYADTNNNPAYNRDMVRGCRQLVLLLCVAGAVCLAQAKQLAVITDPANAVSDLSTADLVKIFNAHTQTWPDGKPVKLVMHDPSSAEMRLVVRKLMAMTPEQAEAFLQSHPHIMVIADSDDAVLKLVSGTRGAIGIVDLFSITKDVKVLKIDGKLPVEPGYVLRGN
jgi:ABC-type phosphate transport system substrate-binding protein